MIVQKNIAAPGNVFAKLLRISLWKGIGNSYINK